MIFFYAQSTMTVISGWDYDSGDDGGGGGGDDDDDGVVGVALFCLIY